IHIGRIPLDPFDARRGRTLFAPGDQIANGLPITLDEHFDGAVRPVAHPSADAEPLRLLLAGGTEDHALDATMDNGAVGDRISHVDDSLARGTALPPAKKPRNTRMSS